MENRCNPEYGMLRATSEAWEADETLRENLGKLGLVKLEGAGRSAHYRLTGNRLKNGSNGSPKRKNSL